jgi:hypothetical protein
LGFLCSFRARAATCVWSRGYVNGSGGWICRCLASPVASGVSTATVDPATSWDEPGCPPLAPGSCEPPGDCCAPLLTSGSCEPLGDCCAPPLALGSYELPGDGPPLAPGSCEAPSCGPPVAPGNWESHGCVLSPRGWRASKLRPCELVLRLQTLQPVKVEGQVVVVGLGRERTLMSPRGGGE